MGGQCIYNDLINMGITSIKSDIAEGREIRCSELYSTIMGMRGGCAYPPSLQQKLRSGSARADLQTAFWRRHQKILAAATEEGRRPVDESDDLCVKMPKLWPSELKRKMMKKRAAAEEAASSSSLKKPKVSVAAEKIKDDKEEVIRATAVEPDLKKMLALDPKKIPSPQKGKVEKKMKKKGPRVKRASSEKLKMKIPSTIAESVEGDREIAELKKMEAVAELRSMMERELKLTIRKLKKKLGLYLLTLL